MNKTVIVVYQVDDEYGHKNLLKVFDSMEKAQTWFDTSDDCEDFRSYGWVLYTSPEQFNLENGGSGIVAEEVIVL
jgi:hypothetical protein